MSNNEMIDILTIVLVVMIAILFILSTVFIILKLKNLKSKRKKIPKEKESNFKQEVNASKENKSYNKKSIFDFMNFDKIEDNMIVQDDGKRFLMVTECQGINYDLMSGLEKNSVEQGFLQFLNTLRHPIQIYVQTRTVNLSNSINSYKQRINDIGKDLTIKQADYNQKVRLGEYERKELEREQYEVVRQRNLYEYGVDIINNTERMSLNKNILSKRYYIIISYYSEKIENTNFDKEEIKNLAFSELYTKSQSMISALSVCGINSKVLDSTELAELLYVAYNRDESEIYDLRKSLNAGYEDLYSTAPNVLDKRMRELDLKIQEEAVKRANDEIINAMEMNEKQRKIDERERNLDNLIDVMTKSIIEENEEFIGRDIAEKAKKNIDNKKTTEKGGAINEKKEKNARGTTRNK